MGPPSNPIPSHLRLLWDHLINRTLATESTPTSRVQHILDDMDLLLATLSDFISICLVKDRDDRTADDSVVLMSLTLSEAIGVERGSWHLRNEDEIPAKYRTIFAERPGVKKKVVAAATAHKEVSTFEQTFATFNEVSILVKKEEGAMVEDDFALEDLAESAEEVEGEDEVVVVGSAARGRKRKAAATKECKLDFQIVDKLFVCKAPNCTVEGFQTLPLLKSHFDAIHSNDPPREEDERPSTSESPPPPLSKKEETLPGSMRREVIITPSGQKYVWQRKNYVRKKKPRPPAPPKPKKVKVDEDPAPLPQAILETLNMPRRHLLKCYVCDFTCRNQLDLESHTKTQHPDVDPYKCDQCEFTAAEKKFLISHKRSKHLLEFRCNVCDHRFGYKNHLETHMASHSTENTVMCHLCGKGFKCTKYLRKHLRFTHAEQNSYLCGLCGRSFKHQSSYETHLKSKHETMAQSLNLTGNDDA